MSDKSQKPVDTPTEWLRYAEENLQVAEREMQTSMPAFHTICFLCQSASEKFLKGYLISQGWILEKIHDLVALLAICASYDADWETLVNSVAILNEYVVSGRYPGEISFEIIGRTEAEEALTAAQQIRAHVRSYFAN